MINYLSANQKEAINIAAAQSFLFPFKYLLPARKPLSQTPARKEHPLPQSHKASPSSLSCIVLIYPHPTTATYTPQTRTRQVAYEVQLANTTMSTSHPQPERGFEKLDKEGSSCKAGTLLQKKPRRNSAKDLGKGAIPLLNNREEQHDEEQNIVDERRIKQLKEKVKASCKFEGMSMKPTGQLCGRTLNIVETVGWFEEDMREFDKICAEYESRIGVGLKELDVEVIQD